MLPILRGDVPVQNPALTIGSIKVSPIVKVTQAQVQNLATTEVQIVPGLANNVLIPYFIAVKKFAGAYTVAGIGSNGLMLGYGSVADNLPCCCWGNSPAFSILVESLASTYFVVPVIGNGAAAGLPYGPVAATGSAVAVVGKKLAIRTISASPAGAGGDMRFRIWYYQVPVARFDFPL